MPRRPFFSQCCGATVCPVPTVWVAAREYSWRCEACAAFTALTHLPLPVAGGDFVRVAVRLASGGRLH